jgi:ribosomal protein S18 acetylase RimI-like enzyme
MTPQPSFQEAASGHGRALLAAALSHARSLGGVRQLKLGLNATATASQLLYQSAGFTSCGTEPDALPLRLDEKYYDEQTCLSSIR